MATEGRITMYPFDLKDILTCLFGFALFFGPLHLALKVPLRIARIVFKLIKYGIILNFLILVLAFRSLSGDKRCVMLMGGAIWASMILCFVGGRADDYERSMGRGNPAIPVLPGRTSKALMAPQEKKADKFGIVVALLILVGIAWFLVWVQFLFHFTLVGVLGATIIGGAWYLFITQ
jgi:hypothetical protein